MKLVKATIVFLLLIASLFFLKRSVSAQACAEISDLTTRINCYEKELGRLGAQSKTLANQIAQFDAQIRLTTLKISQTEEKIVLLGGRIDQLETSLNALSNAFSSRAVETYKMARVGDAFLILISAPDLTGAVSRFHYLQKIQEADRDLLSRLQAAQITYQGEKTDQETLQKELGVQKANLNSQKAAKANLLAATKNDEKNYQKLLAEAKAQLAALRRFVIGQGGASILNNQTKCDGWGCYYNQRDSLWGNIGMGGSSYSVAEYGCLITSVSMIASHYGKDIKPGDIAVNSNFFVPGTGYLYHSAEGMPFSLTSVSKDSLDSELSKGPVIAGLYGGPDHFIVILRKEGSNYIMHDPFIPDGGNRPLTDKYNVSDITSLRLVQFN